MCGRQNGEGGELSSILIVLSVAVLFLITASEGHRLPPYLGTCHKKDVNRNLCMKESINKMIKTIKSGSKDLDLPPIDPLQIPLLEFSQGSGNMSIHVVLKNTVINGLSGTDIYSVKANIEDRKFEVASKTPFFDVYGQYSCEGSLLSFPIVGQGPFHINMTDVTAVWIFYYSTIRVNNSDFITIEKFYLDVIPSDITYFFGGILDGDNKLGAALNMFLNENSHEIFNDLKPTIMKLLSEILSVIGNQVLSNFPEDVLLPP